MQCDVTSKESLGNAAATIKSETSFVNAVVANSGVDGPGLKDLPENATLEQFQEYLWTVPMEAINNTFAINTTAVLYTCLAFLPLLHAGNEHKDSPGFKHNIKSQFISTSSIASFNRKATAGFAYGASKAAQNHLMKMLAHYLAPYMIRTNVLAPGLFASEMTAVRSINGVQIYTDTGQPLYGDKDPTVEGFMSGSVVPLKRYGSEEVCLSIC